VPNYTVYQKTEYQITADSAEEAREKWMNSDWDWSLEDEPETCSVYDWRGVEVWRP
jgi:hypothetical protein